jgi:hypothetical protein
VTKHRVKQKDGFLRIDRQGYNTEDASKKTERVDVSPFGTEGIFIDADPPAREGEKNERDN